MKFANEFSKSLLGTDSVNFPFICLLFGAKRIAEINRTLVKTRHFCEGFTQLTAACFFPGEQIWRESCALSLRDWLVQKSRGIVTWVTFLLLGVGRETVFLLLQMCSHFILIVCFNLDFAETYFLNCTKFSVVYVHVHL